MRKAIVDFSLLKNFKINRHLFAILTAFLVALPLTAVWAQFDNAGTAVEKITNVTSKLLLATPLLTVAALVNVYVSLLGLLSLQMIHFFLKLAAFNDFINFAPVVTGWTIVRDVVNMSFVILLLIIAISTILNIEAYSYRRLLPRLALMAILINFSRTIAGLLIDAGQVVMLTFVNAFSAAAGGNFISALKINDLLSIGNGGLLTLEVTIPTILSSYILASGAITVTFIVMLTFVGILLFRVLALWFLIILSPLAFALGAWPSGGVSKFYGQWWDEFTKNIICPTMLSFFLWLALMMMSTDYVNVLAPGLSASGDKSVPLEASVTQLAVPETFASFLISIGLLLMSLKMTQTMCSSIGGGIGTKMLDFAKSKGIAAAKLAGKGALLSAGATIGLAGKGIGAGLRKAGFEGQLPQLPSAPNFKERGLSVMANIPIVRGWARGKLGEGRAERTKIMAAAGGKLTELTPAEMDRVADLKPPILTPNNAAERTGQLYKLLTDKQYQKHLKDTYGEEGADKRLGGIMKEYNEVSKVAPTPEIARKAMDVKKFRPDLLPANSPDFKNLVDNMTAEEVKGLTADTFKKTMGRSEMSPGTKAAWAQYAMSGSPALRGAALQYRAAHPPAEDESFAEFTQKKLDNKLRISDVGVDEMKNSKIVVEVATNQKNYSGELDALLKRNDTRSAMRETLLQSRADRLSGKVKDTDVDGNVVGAIVGTGDAATYNPTMQGITETALRAGASLEQTYNIDVNNSNFKEVAERNAFGAALKGNNRVDIILNSNLEGLSTNNYKNEISETVAKSLTYPDVREMMSKAKESGEQDNVFNVVEAMRHYAAQTNDPAVVATVEAIEGNRNLTRRLEKIGGKSDVSVGGTPSSPSGGGGGTGGGSAPPLPSAPRTGGGGGRGGRGGGGTGGGSPPAPNTPPLDVGALEASLKEDIKKQVEEQVKKVGEAEFKRLELEKARDNEPKVEKRRQIQEQIKQALENERKEKEELSKIQPRGNLEL